MSATEETEPNVTPTPVRTIATLGDLVAAIERKRQRPNIDHVDRETGLTFVLRELTGEDMEVVSTLSGGDETRYAQQLAERASVDPKIDLMVWEALGKLGPSVRAGIILKINETSHLRMIDMEDAKNA